MRPLRQHNGLAAPLDRSNVDTDQIIPKQFLKRMERTGLGQFLFYDWAHAAGGEVNPEFTLNQPRYRGASILLAGRNFGCGSSREHAAWALLDRGFRAVIAPSFADIFTSNCYQNGIAPIALPEVELAGLMRNCLENSGYRLLVDLESQTVSDPAGFSAHFRLDDYRRHCLLEGLDDIALTLQHEPEIAAFEQARPSSAER